MITFDEFLKQLPENIKESAFLIGNGINRYRSSKNKQAPQSWMGILIDYTKKYFPKKNANFFKILKKGDISFTEIFDIIQLQRYNNQTDNIVETFNYDSIKKDLKRKIQLWEGTAFHEKWVNTLRKVNRPVLTINVDTILEKSSTEIIKEHKKNKRYKSNRFLPLIFKKDGRNLWSSDSYPWHCYYSDHLIKDANKEFAIWHIHGISEYHRSLKFGLSDYINITAKAKGWIYQKDNDNKQYKLIVNYENWVGRNSWLDVFLNNDLIIMGVGLPVSETSLRWLLIEREKLFKKNVYKRKKTWFLYNERFNEMPEGKKLFLEELGCTVVESNPSKSFGRMLTELSKKKYHKSNKS